jgi:NADH-quinone oxidoreductase subunit G
MNSDVTVHEPQVQQDPESPLAFSMEGYDGVPPASLVPRFWAPGWNSPQAVDKYQVHGPDALSDGEPRVRLLEQAHGGPITYHGTVPEAFKKVEGRFVLVPLYHLFGSEELSAHSPEIREISPEPYLGLNPDDAKDLGIENDGTVVEIVLDSGPLILPVKLVAGLYRGVAGLPMGLPGSGWVDLSQAARIRKGPVKDG